LYCDTDSVNIIQKDNDPVNIKMGDCIVDLTDELEEYRSFIKEFVLGGPKKNAFSVYCYQQESFQQNVKRMVYRLIMRIRRR